jgi:hypothetical protein
VEQKLSTSPCALSIALRVANISAMFGSLFDFRLGPCGGTNDTYDCQAKVCHQSEVTLIIDVTAQTGQLTRN